MTIPQPNHIHVNPLPTDPFKVLAHKSPLFRGRPWQVALAENDPQAAIRAFVKELREGGPRTSLETDLPVMVRNFFGQRGLAWTHGQNHDADLIVEQRYIGISGIEHHFEGEIDWHLDPTADRGEKQELGWRAFFNRHLHWVALADRFLETGEGKYVRAFEKELRSWIAQSNRPEDDGRADFTCWRPIELGIRCGWTWPYAFEAFRRSPDLSDEALWLMVCSMAEQGLQLLLWPTKLNIKSMEINGLIHVGCMFPELFRARTFADTGLDRACAELDRQVYPDGMQKELAPDYAILVFNNLFSGLELVRRRAVHEAVVPPEARARLAKMAASFAGLADPEGRIPAIHDSPPQRIDDLARLTGPVLGNATPELWKQDRFQHFPWAGWTVSNSEAGYWLLDSGPWGGKHQHADALQWLLYANNRWLLIDPGKPVYDKSKLRRHVKSSAGHNVVLMDRKCHLPDPFNPVLEESPYPAWSAAEGSVRASAVRRFARTPDSIHNTDMRRSQRPKPSDEGFWHERMILEMQHLGWLVVDRLQAEQPESSHTWEWLWHSAGPVSLSAETNSAALDAGPGSELQVHVAATVPVQLEVLAGMEEPVIRGWRPVGDAGQIEPSPVLSCQTPATAGPVVAATLFRLQESGTPAAKIQHFQATSGQLQVRVSAGDAGWTVQCTGVEEWNNLEIIGPDAETRRFSIDPHSTKKSG